MPRWTGTWLTGLASAGVETRPAGTYPGQHLGLPEAGPGSVAAFGARLGALLLDVVAGSLIGGLFQASASRASGPARALPGNLGFLVEVSVLVALTGQSLGMRGLRIRVLRTDRPESPVGFLRSVGRTLLLMLLVPAVVRDRDGRGLHDRATRTVVVRA